MKGIELFLSLLLAAIVAGVAAAVAGQYIAVHPGMMGMMGGQERTLKRLADYMNSAAGKDPGGATTTTDQCALKSSSTQELPSFTSYLSQGWVVRTAVPVSNYPFADVILQKDDQAVYCRRLCFPQGHSPSDQDKKAEIFLTSTNCMPLR